MHDVYLELLERIFRVFLAILLRTSPNYFDFLQPWVVRRRKNHSVSILFCDFPYSARWWRCVGLYEWYIIALVAGSGVGIDLDSSHSFISTCFLPAVGVWGRGFIWTITTPVPFPRYNEPPMAPTDLYWQLLWLPGPPYVFWFDMSSPTEDNITVLENWSVYRYGGIFRTSFRGWKCTCGSIVCTRTASLICR